MDSQSYRELMEEGKRRYVAGEFVEASHALREAVALAPDSIEAWRALGFSLKSSGNSPDAIGAFHRALEIDPQDADSYFGLGLVFSETGDTETAVEWFDKALATKPAHGRAKAALVSTLVRQGRLRLLNGDKSRGGASLERANKLMPGSAETVVPYVEHLVDVQRYKEAFDTVEAALKLAPRDPAMRELHAALETDPRLARAKRENSLM